MQKGDVKETKRSRETGSIICCGLPEFAMGLVRGALALASSAAVAAAPLFHADYARSTVVVPTVEIESFVLQLYRKFCSAMRGLVLACVAAVLPGVALSFRGLPCGLAPGARAMRRSDVSRRPHICTPVHREPLLMSVTQDSSDLLQVESDFGYDRSAIDRRFSSQPLEVAKRTGQVLAAVARVKLAGDTDGGQTLRRELASLGPVFCKVGQTLATRPDIVGAETSRKLGQLQDAMAPEPDAATAFSTLRTFLREQGLHSGEAGDPIDDVFTEISREPVAAASLAEVYRATTRDGVDVAVKIQRPGLEKKIALDFYVLLKLLGLAQERFQISESLDIVEAVLDEVGTGIFKELDFQQEARHIMAFREMYAAELEDLGVIVPHVITHLTGKQGLVTKWIAPIP